MLYMITQVECNETEEKLSKARAVLLTLDAQAKQARLNGADDGAEILNISVCLVRWRVCVCVCCRSVLGARIHLSGYAYVRKYQV